jgi:DNA polymerase elongation subunit (family B)
MILGLKKIMYTGNLRTLYQQDPNKFIAYAIIDTILVMLIHKKTNLYDVDFFEAYFNGIAYNKISQNTISEALVYNELRSENIFLLSEEYNVTVKQKYEGGYVKLPLQKIIEACIGVDFSGLYPNSIITIGISPERKVDTIKVDANGYPKTQEDMDIWLKYKAQNCCLSPLGRIYSLEGGDGLFPRIEKKLIAQRKIFKGHAEDIYLNVKQKITERIKELKALEAQKL